MPGSRTVAGAARAIRAGEVTARQLVEECHARADRLDAEFGVFLTRFGKRALAAADTADAELAAGHDRGPLHGIPLAVKDLIGTREAPTTGQSLVSTVDLPAGDAGAVARLRAAGAVIVGKTTLAEHGMGVPDPAKPFPVPRNPWDPRAWTGGSSSGTAGGIAAGIFPGGLGTDTGGSIRLPAAMCGITGLRPTFGRVPTAGTLPMASTMDTVGPMARTAEDCLLLFDALAGCSAPAPRPDGLAGCSPPAPRPGGLAGLRIGVADLLEHSHTVHPDQPARFAAAVAALAGAGADVVEVRLPLYLEVCAAGKLTQISEALTVHLPTIRANGSGYATASRAYLTAGAGTTATDYLIAQRIRRTGRRQFRELFATVDIVVTPTTTTPAPMLAALDPYDLAGTAGCYHTGYWSALGLPALSVPIGFTAQGLPLGMQIAGHRHADHLVLAAGHAYQQLTDWHTRCPPTIAG